MDSKSHEKTLRQIVSRLQLSHRLTHYQLFCIEVVDRALELPVKTFLVNETAYSEKLGDRKVFSSLIIQKWLLAAAEIDPLSAMVLLDAIDQFVDILGPIRDEYYHDFFDRTFKKSFTQYVGGIEISFAVPFGWELLVKETRLGKGIIGSAVVARCHLSESFTHTNHVLPELLGRGSAEMRDVGYFNVPCSQIKLFGDLPLEVSRWLIQHGGTTGVIPFSWIVARSEYDAGAKRDVKLPAPSEENVLEVANKAIGALRQSGDDGDAWVDSTTT